MRFRFLCSLSEAALGEVVRIEKEEESGENIAFDDFWILYPRRVAKKDALKAWLKIDPGSHAEILTSLASWRGVWLARGEPQYIPYPASWLNGERWTDELPPGNWIPMTRAQVVPTQAIAAASVPRAPMPDHVRAMIAKLKAGKA